jgi:hypothetical protein
MPLVRSTFAAGTVAIAVAVACRWYNRGVRRRVCSLAAKGLLAWALSGCAALAAPATATSPAVERARDVQEESALQASQRDAGDAAGQGSRHPAEPSFADVARAADYHGLLNGMARIHAPLRGIEHEIRAIEALLIDTSDDEIRARLRRRPVLWAHLELGRFAAEAAGDDAAGIELAERHFHAVVSLGAPQDAWRSFGQQQIALSCLRRGDVACARAHAEAVLDGLDGVRMQPHARHQVRQMARWVLAGTNAEAP